MRASVGTVYHIRDSYYALTKGISIKQKYNDHTYPAYHCRRDIDSRILWMIPMSTKIDKYQAIISAEMEKYGHCHSVVIGMYDNKEVAFQIQGIFPITEAYILHPHTRNGRTVPVNRALREEIRWKLDKMWELYQKGVNCFLCDIQRIEALLQLERRPQLRTDRF